jgi:hypothetical protein
VETAEDGTVSINNRYSSYNLSRTENDLDPNIYAVILKFEQQEDSVALREQVESAYSEAVASDVDLATMLSATIPNAMTNWMDSISESDTGAPEENDTETADNADENSQDTAQTEEPSDQSGAEDNSQDAAQEETPTDQTGADENPSDAAQTEEPADQTGGDGNDQDAVQEETPADNGDGDAAQEETTKKVVKVKITAKTVNVREEPNTSSDVLGKVKRDETYTELDDLDGWFAISYNGQTGYVKADYVTEVTE